MHNRNLIYGMTFFIIIVIIILTAISTRFSYHEISSMKSIECLVRTNNYTGDTCMIGGLKCAYHEPKMKVCETNK